MGAETQADIEKLIALHRTEPERKPFPSFKAFTAAAIALLGIGVSAFIYSLRGDADRAAYQELLNRVPVVANIAHIHNPPIKIRVDDTETLRKRHTHRYSTPAIVDAKVHQIEIDETEESDIEKRIQSEFGINLRLEKGYPTEKLEEFEKHLRNMRNPKHGNPALVDSIRGMDIHILPANLRGCYSGIRSSNYIELFEPVTIPKMAHEFDHQFRITLVDDYIVYWGDIVEKCGFRYGEKFEDYRVISGDTLSKIGQTFGIPYILIANDNNISNPNHIRSGQELKIRRWNDDTPILAPPSAMKGMSTEWYDGTKGPRWVFPEPYAANLTDNLPLEHSAVIREMIYKGISLVVSPEEERCLRELFSYALEEGSFSEAEYKHALSLIIPVSEHPKEIKLRPLIPSN